jgi:DNA-directed RNA polymerase subunit M/transcription elongation factor TFIIS
MSKLVFKSGFEIEFPQREWDLNIRKLKQGGVRLHMIEDEVNGLIAIPLTESSIERVMRGLEEEEVSMILESNEEAIVYRPDKMDKIEQKKETKEEKNMRLLEIMKEKSSCKHESEKLVLHKQKTKNGLRYFYVCSFCGHRGRYEKKADLISAGFDLEAAAQWEDK